MRYISIKVLNEDKPRELEVKDIVVTETVTTLIFPSDVLQHVVMSLCCNIQGAMFFNSKEGTEDCPVFKLTVPNETIVYISRECAK